jgi:NAD(P)-dependent dehydrogenase (short-subunit alcohol dehydrogenase family)
VERLGEGGAVVTGGGNGLGRSLARKLAAVGYDVAVLDVDISAATRVADEIAESGGRAFAVPCDVSIAEEIAGAARIVRERIADLRLVWANAGIGHLGGLVSGPGTGFDWIFSVNVSGTIHTLRAFVPALLASSGLRHVGFTASVAGLVTVGERTPGYGASKYAVIGLAESLRAELAAKGVGVTIACPGLVNTEIWNGARARPERFGGAFPAPREAGERHRTQGLSADWVVERIWEQVERGGGYVAPVTGPDVLAEFDARTAEVRAGFRW